MPHCVSPAVKEAVLRRKGKAPSRQHHSQARNRCTFLVSYQNHTLRANEVTISCHVFGEGGRAGLEVRRQVHSRSQIVLVWARTEVLLCFFLPMCTWARSWVISDFIRSHMKWEHNACLTGLLKRMSKWQGRNANEIHIFEKITAVNNCYHKNVSPTKREPTGAAQTPWSAHYVTDAELNFTHIITVHYQNGPWGSCYYCGHFTEEKTEA